MFPHPKSWIGAQLTHLKPWISILNVIHVTVFTQRTCYVYSCELMKQCPLQRRSADFSSPVKVWRKWSVKQYIRRHSCKVSTTYQQLIHSSILKSLQHLCTTGIMEAKLLAALSLLLAVGQFTGEQNQNRNQKHSFLRAHSVYATILVPKMYVTYLLQPMVYIWRDEVMLISSMCIVHKLPGYSHEGASVNNPYIQASKDSLLTLNISSGPNNNK